MSVWSILLLVFGIVLSSGALIWWINAGFDMKLAQRDSAEAKKKADEVTTKVAVVESKVAEHSNILEEIRTRLSKLDRVDEMVAAVAYIKETVAQNATHVAKSVPREEHEHKWQSDSERFNRIEADLTRVKDELGAKI
jgi:archaellum component FlaC